VSLDIVLVIWGDAHAEIEDHSHSTLATYDSLITHTVGFLVSESTEGVMLTTTEYQDEELADQAGDYHYIPRGMIIDLRVLKDTSGTG